MKIEVKETKIRKVKVLPCVICGSDDIRIYNCGYSSFNVAGGECNKCKNKALIRNCSWDISDSEIVKFWNNKNDPKKLIKKLKKEKKIIQFKINQLKNNLPF